MPYSAKMPDYLCTDAFVLSGWGCKRKGASGVFLLCYPCCIYSR